ncbi:Tetratricopeptide repeat protein [Posidoniimonas polymericola]|uniref:Tetratricopeptide repeat protein n=2 Tax=Posidoniimonas polymericola TaxID=2528002 RepID=A0A5C5YM65_9BACT|nr:Tetratricopeptide repeat protein [Posidoniimonas polymericola]
MSDPSEAPTDFAPRAGRGVTAATRQRLEALHTRAKACLERGDHDYAHDLLTQCIAEDPGSLIYAQTFRANIAKKYAGGGKKSSMFGSLVGKTGRAAVAKAAGKGAWTEAFTAGCQALKKNPVDLPVLRELATGCGELGHTETQLFYLRWALDLDLHDVETNRLGGEATAKSKQYEQAIACWQRVLKQKPEDEEARRAISRLSVEQTLHEGGYDHELLKGEGATPDLPAIRVSDLASKESDGQPRRPATISAEPAAEESIVPPLSREELEEVVEEEPKNLTAAGQLARILHVAGESTAAIELLRRTLAASPDPESPDPESPEQAKLEEAQLQMTREHVEATQDRAKATRKPAEIKQAKQAMVLSNQAELEVFAARAKRNPASVRDQLELGLRLKRGGNHREAIKALQAARGDARREAEVQLHLGECFQHIEQFKLAASSYEAAIKASATESAHASEETHKLALYRAGVLALGLGDLDRAENRLTELAGHDFGYRDVSDRLDKIADLRKNA